MIFVGLLTHQQKQAGYFVAQDEDFIYLFHRGDGVPWCIAVFPYETTTIREVREAANGHLQENTLTSRHEAKRLPA